MADFALPGSLKLISRKIWVTEKFLKFPHCFDNLVYFKVWRWVCRGTLWPMVFGLWWRKMEASHSRSSWKNELLSRRSQKEFLVNPGLVERACLFKDLWIGIKVAMGRKMADWIPVRFDHLHGLLHNCSHLTGMCIQCLNQKRLYFGFVLKLWI